MEGPYRENFTPWNFFTRTFYNAEISRCTVLNWTLRPHGPSNNPSFLPFFMFCADLVLLDCQAWVAMQNEVLCVNKGQKPFCVGTLHPVSSENFHFQLANYYKIGQRLCELTCSIVSTHGRFCLVWILTFAHTLSPLPQWQWCHHALFKYMKLTSQGGSTLGKFYNFWDHFWCSLVTCALVAISQKNLEIDRVEWG